MMRRVYIIALLMMLIINCFTACLQAKSFDLSAEIHVISREDGSGTRGAFTAFFGIVQQFSDGRKKDCTTKEAVIAKQTDIMLGAVAGDARSIGYLSLGTYNKSVKAIAIDGIFANTETVQNGQYALTRPFSMVTNGKLSALAEDFIRFALSKEGQEIVSEINVPAIDLSKPFVGSNPSGKIIVAGSSSVVPIIEKHKEAYLEKNPFAKIEIQQSDSSSGIAAAREGVCDIALSSRELTMEESADLDAQVVAYDGIILITNWENPCATLTKEQVKRIFTGEITTWEEVNHA